MIFISANDAFANPNSPWYYVVGSAFLVLIIAALVVYLLVSKKKREAAEKKIDVEITDTLPPDAHEVDNTKSDNDSQEDSPVPEETDDKPTTAPEEPVEEVKDRPEQNSEIKEEKAEVSKVEEKVNEPAAEENAHQPEQKQKPKVRKTNTPIVKMVKETGAETKPSEEIKQAPAPKKTTTTAKKTQKPFVDRLIAAKDAHGVYNELKNAILSYPGMKAKLNKDGETFSFATQNKAEISLDGTKIMLKVAVNPEDAAQFGAQACDGELKTKLVVSTGNIDNANKLITYAMNMSMLTRNDKHRHVDYVQNAINAKNKAKAKQSAAKKK